MNENDLLVGMGFEISEELQPLVVGVRRCMVA